MKKRIKTVSDHPFILASASPRRFELLKGCGIDFCVKTADAEELDRDDDIFVLPQKNALLKARAVATEYPGSWVLGADTMIIFENRAIGKPADLHEAAVLLRNFSGKCHEVVTGVALICRQAGVCEVWSETSTVKFKTLSDAVIGEYLSKVQVLDKAGAYAIQEHGELIVENFSGELENIVGLPLKKLQNLLTKYAIGDKL